MQKEQFQNGKRLLLIVDDEPINRELLGEVLREEYELLQAADGLEALRLAEKHRHALSLVLLDLLMPGMSGLEFLRRIQEDPILCQIPVIVLTADQDAEVESLSLGASDFIPKPYPRADVILARIRRTIELHEDRQIIQSTERDPLTNLYNREYFYRYAERLDRRQTVEMDAIVVDVNHFHMINERFGNLQGDEILRRIGGKLQELAGEGSIACRREADTFLLYCPHGREPQLLLDSLEHAANETGAHVRLRMGVYACVDRQLNIEQRFDRAKSAADQVRNSFARAVGVYDDAMHERELYAEQLIEDFRQALAERQFQVWYQPKFNIRPEVPVLASAEALVRWQHPTLGMINPGVFIPLFEENGLIQTLDQYIWQEAAAQIRDWKARYGFTVPVSVNVSRIDMFDRDLVGIFRRILEDNGLAPHEFLLEITESAYTENSGQIIDMVNQLRSQGFRIEMDDFGTGYSSLNMISELPIDALKLDMQFIRSAFQGRRDTRMLEIVLDIAEYLEVPVIAEGVETEEQLNALKAMGCDMAQGYYFSRPLPPAEFERFFAERLSGDALPESFGKQRRSDRFGKITNALTCGFERVYDVNTDSGRYVEYSSGGRYEDLKIRRSGADFFRDAEQNVQQMVYLPDQERVLAGVEKQTLLDRLADSRSFSMTYRQMIDGVPTYYSLMAVRASTHDEHHVVIGVSNVDDQLRNILEEETEPSFQSLSRALSRDMESIYYVDTDTEQYQVFVTDGAYGNLQLHRTGTEFFEETKMNIPRVVFEDDRERITAALDRGALLAALEERSAVSMDYRLMIEGRPTYYRLKAIRAEQDKCRHIIIGISNIDGQVAEEQRKEAQQAEALRQAREVAYRDALTGVKSKYAFMESEGLWNERARQGEITELAVVCCDLNGLKQINDTQGHLAGDRYLKKACTIICEIFKHSPVFRIGGDEFAVILGEADFPNRAALLRSLRDHSEQANREGGVVVASGMAEWRPGEDTGLTTLFERADAAMYENKRKLKEALA